MSSIIVNNEENSRAKRVYRKVKCRSTTLIIMNDISRKISLLRREYSSHPLSRRSVDSDPMIQFRHWFEEVMNADQPDPEAMTLSTATPEGRVSARIVLLKGFDSRGFSFFTNFESRKGKELSANPRAALTFYWFTLNRQVRIEGEVERVSEEESIEYFRTRPRGSQIGAWASPQSAEIPNREILEELVAEHESRFGQYPIELPPHWGGFRVKPDCIEFWQGRESRLHDRIKYTRDSDSWEISRLAP